MRQRKINHEEVPAAAVLRTIAAADFFSKPKEDYQREQTKGGAIISAITIGFITLLVLWEGMGYVFAWNAYDTDLGIDSNTNRRMDVNLDIVFPSNPCTSLSIDLRDSGGDRKLNVSQASLQKIPLTARGEAAFLGDVYDAEIYDPGESDEGSCLRCFVRGDLEKVTDRADSQGVTLVEKCCTTCEEVREAYQKAGLPFPDKFTIPQCINEIASSFPGCRVVGTLHLKKIDGILVFAPRRAAAGNFHLLDAARFRVDHKINKMILGDPRVQRFSRVAVTSPLEGHSYQGAAAEVMYFLKVVPTTYSTRQVQPSTVRTYEYAVQTASRKVYIGLDNRVPAVMFAFSFEPIQIDNFFRRPPFAKLLVRVCCICGGFFTVAGFLSRFF